MYLTSLAATAAIASAAGPIPAQPFNPFAFPGTVSNSAICDELPAKVPENLTVLAAGAGSGRTVGFQIDRSGRNATLINVAVNVPSKPVVLILAAYQPTVWHIGWTKTSTIHAVVVSGKYRQEVVGLTEVMTVTNSTHENEGPCGYFYVNSWRQGPLNAFAQRHYGRAVDMIYSVKNGNVVVGDAIAPGTPLDTAADVKFDAVSAPTSSLMGRLGLEDAVKRGILRHSTPDDELAWNAAQANKVGIEVQLSTGGGLPVRILAARHGYVVLKAFDVPAGMFWEEAVTFFVPKGVPQPRGNLGYYSVYDFNTMLCRGSACDRNKVRDGSFH